MTTTALITQSLELLAESDEDIYARVYEIFFSHSAHSLTLMSHMDELTRGRMLEEVTRLLLSEDIAAEDAYLEFEVNNHQLAYSVEAPMYQSLFEAFHLAVREVSGDRWLAEFDLAWESRTNELLTAMHRHMTP